MNITVNRPDKLQKIALVATFAGASSILVLVGAGLLNSNTIGDGYEKRCNEIRADFEEVAKKFSSINYPEGYSRTPATITRYINATDVGGFLGFQNFACKIVFK